MLGSHLALEGVEGERKGDAGWQGRGREGMILAAVCVRERERRTNPPHVCVHKEEEGG